MGMPHFDYCQRIYTMADLANAVMIDENTAERLDELLFYKLSYYLHVDQDTKVSEKYKPFAAPNETATTCLGDGLLVWGPCLFVGGPTPVGPATNAAFVVRFDNFPGPANMPRGPLYIVAIAATNPTSLKDLVKQDGDVNQVVRWDRFKPFDGTIPHDPPEDPDTVAYISRGTAQGVADVYCKLRPQAWLNQEQLTLAEFLRSIETKPGAAVIFCGHSLAGALSPTLALYMLTRDSSQPLKAFDGGVYTYPTAGATPGNGPFVDAFTQVFPTIRFDEVGGPQYAVMNARIWNHYDVVPHAWALSAAPDFDGNVSPKLQDIPTLYGVLDLVTAEQVYLDIWGAERLSQASGVDYRTLPGARLDTTRPPTPKTYGAFWETLLSCHIRDYSHGLILPDGLPGGKPPNP